MVVDKNARQSPAESDHDNDNEVKYHEEKRTLRCRQKLLHDLDKFRRHGCQEKINGMLMKVQQSTQNAAREKIHQQENVWLANQARYLKDEEEIYHKLHEEEEESRKRQEQLVFEHEQHARRVNEISKIIIRVEEKERENEERTKQLNLHKRMITEKCHSYVMEYRSVYEGFLDILKACKDRRALADRCASSVAKLKSLSDLMDNRIVEKCKNMAVTDEDLHTCAKTVEEAKQIVSLVEAAIETINKEHDQAMADAKLKEKTISAQSAVPDKPAPPDPNPVANKYDQTSSVPAESSVLREYVNEDAYKMYTSLNIFREQFAKSCENIAKDDRMKNFRFECQKAVNLPVNAIAPVSAAHLQDKLSKLQRLLSGQTVEVGRSHFAASQHPQGIDFCKDLLAKKFVAQGETTVSAKPEAAFAIAAVIVSLWSEFPDFGRLLLANFYKECPYLVPFFLPRLVGQSDTDYYKSQGYRYSENGEVEKQDKFLKRMSGIMHLYCAVIITPLRRHSNRLHPLGIQEAWRWIACTINLDPRPDICATLLYEFLEVAGHFMFSCYGPVFQKVLHLLCTEYYHKLEEVTPSGSRGPVARLESFLQKILKQGRINPPVGLLPVDFW